MDLKKEVIMNEGFLENLNLAIDQVIEEKKELNIDYDVLEDILLKIINNNKLYRENLVMFTPIKKDDMLKITLDFFKSIDPYFQKKAVNIILQQSENIKMNIYNVHRIKNFKKRDEQGFLEYTRTGGVSNRHGFAIVHIPTNGQLKSKETGILSENECTLMDLYTLVHEISHLFDINMKLAIPDRKTFTGEKRKNKKSMCLEFISEGTSMAFEQMLSEYLLKNTSVSTNTIKQLERIRFNSCLYITNLAYTKLILAKEKEKNGEITIEFLEEYMKNRKFSIQDIRNEAYDIINNSQNVLYEKRYSTGMLIAPTIVKKYKENGSDVLKNYIEKSKNDNFEEVMKVLGIELNEQGIDKLIYNMKEQSQIFNTKER